MSEIPALGMLRQGDPKFEAILGYTVKPHIKSNKPQLSVRTVTHLSSNVNKDAQRLFFLVTTETCVIKRENSLFILPQF